MRDELRLFQDLCEILLQSEDENPIVPPIKIPELFDKIDLALREEPQVDSDFINTLKKLIQHTPKTASNRFFNQLYGGRVPKAVLGDLLAVMLNTSMYTYKVGGPQVGVEKAIINASLELVGFNDHSSGGTIASGGSMSNFIALVAARDAAAPDVIPYGVQRNMIIYTSEACHYSIEKNASLAGIGRNNVRNVKTDSEGKMQVAELERMILEDVKNGHQPFFVNATAGTTVLGAFDPIKPIAEIANNYKLWLHVDGAYCGSVIFSERYRYLVDGVELADSFNYNAHKMLGTPMTCSIFLIKKKEHLYQSLASEADYLFQTAIDDYNPGKTSLQCGRRNDALKLWTLWKSIGTKGLGDMINHQFRMADVARNYIENNVDYHLYSYNDSISVCFNYKNYDAKALCRALYQDAKLLVSHGEFNGQQFIRLVTINSILVEEDISNFFKVLEEFADDDFKSEK